jgi:2-polyprenyl-6-methoxyphenol hydroxylase-like FAD-dependent oxidoreductase
VRRMRIAVAGGSLGGLFAAILLRQDGHEVRVFERSPHGLGGRGAGLVPQREVFDVLRLIGAEAALQIGVVARDRIFLDADGGMPSARPGRRCRCPGITSTALSEPG